MSLRMNHPSMEPNARVGRAFLPLTLDGAQRRARVPAP